MWRSGNYEDCLAKLAKLPMNAAVLALAVQCLVEVPRAESGTVHTQREICTKRDSNMLPAQTCRQANRLGDVVAYVEAAVEKCSALRTAEDLKAVRCSPCAEKTTWREAHLG